VRRVSLQVRIDDLDGAMVSYPWAFVVTVNDDGRSHSIATQPRLANGRLVVDVGRSSLANVAARPEVTLLFPPASATNYSLIVDGVAEVEHDRLAIEPTRAVLHRPAVRV
jgi:hypothetical protein